MSDYPDEPIAIGAKKSLAELASLEWRYNGPIHPYALGDIRACPMDSRTSFRFKIGFYSELLRNKFNALRELQSRLINLRRKRAYLKPPISNRSDTSDHKQELMRAEIRYALRGARFLRRNIKSLVLEMSRNDVRSSVRVLSAHLRTMNALHNALTHDYRNPQTRLLKRSANAQVPTHRIAE